MVLSINGLNFNYSGIRAKKVGKNDAQINFTGDTKDPKATSATFDAIKTQALSNASKSIITTSKTPLGASYNSETNSIDFKVASKNATKIFLSVFEDKFDKNPIKHIEMEKKEGSDIFTASLEAQKEGGKVQPVYYGYRAFGPNWEYKEGFFDNDGTIANPEYGFNSFVDNHGNRFNPNRLAYDPYAQELSHLPSATSGDDFKFIIGNGNYLKNNAIHAPKSVFSVVDNSIVSTVKPRPLTSEIIGEVHLKDLSINEDVEGAGTYVGAKHMAKKVKDLGFTMVEFLPLHEYDDVAGNKNHWGYMSLGYFALAKKYAMDKSEGGALREFRDMVDAYHKEGLKVCMDVVYNHTGEAANINNDPKRSKQMSYSLLDNAMYYKQKNGLYNSNSGCGNDLNVAYDRTMDMVADSVAFYAKQGVDAFRFDLGVGLMDINKDGTVYYDKYKSLSGQLHKMLEERGVKVLKPNETGEGIYLIAEPWTCGGAHTYHLGGFEDHWAQWNDVTRETIKKDAANPFSTTPRALRNSLEGSLNILGDSSKSINYAYSHDGYNLYDGNTHKPEAGSWHFAHDYHGNPYRQENAMKKQIAITLLAKGTPMLQVGDAIAHSKGGDDNSYNKDDATNHLDFSIADDKESINYRIKRFTKNMINFRKEHKEITDAIFNDKITYFKPDGHEAHPYDNSYWDNVNANILCFNIDSDDNLFVSSSSDEHFINIKLPEPAEGKKWNLICDTSKDNSFEGKRIQGNEYNQNPHSLLIFKQLEV